MSNFENDPIAPAVEKATAELSAKLIQHQIFLSGGAYNRVFEAIYKEKHVIAALEADLLIQKKKVELNYNDAKRLLKELELVTEACNRMTTNAQFWEGKSIDQHYVLLKADDVAEKIGWLIDELQQFQSGVATSVDIRRLSSAISSLTEFTKASINLKTTT